MSLEYLFSDYDLGAVFQNHERSAYKEVDEIDADEFLNTSPDDLAAHLVDKYSLDVPILHTSQQEVSVEHSETQVDVSQDFRRAITDPSRPFYIPGVKYTFRVPFDGDGDLLKCRPSSHSMSGPPAGVVDRQEIVLELTTVDPEPEGITRAVSSEIAGIQQHLYWVEAETKSFNEQLPEKVRQRIEGRRERLLRDRGVASALGYKLSQRGDAGRTYVVPTKRRRPAVERPKPQTAQRYEPEPALAQAEYEHILDVLSDVAVVIERNPSAFKRMKEEDLRHHFLLHLNGHYEGGATGETFNFEGKTDILVRVEGRNIFIAECKFWRGPKSLTQTIDQLLGYATWRDTKVAILVFNRTKNLSAVLAAIPGTVEAHPNFKRAVPIKGETRFRFILAHRDDPQRELIVTLLVFEVPV